VNRLRLPYQGQCAVVRWRLGEECGSELSACAKDNPGGECHTDQEAFDVLEVGDLTAFPLPASVL